MPNAPSHEGLDYECQCLGCFWFRHQISDPECECPVCSFDRVRKQHAMQRNNVFSKLLEKAKEEEDSAEWYFDQKAKLKASQWYHNAQLHYAKLAAYALGTILGFTIEEVDVQCKWDEYYKWDEYHKGEERDT